MIKIKGDTPNEKFKHIEIILNRMSRKLHKTIIGVMPPVPIMFAVNEIPESGEIFSFLTPARGMITDICLLIGEFTDKELVSFEAMVKGPTGGMHTTFATRKNLTISKIDLSVGPGDLLSLKTTSPERIKGIWLSFLYQMGIEKAEQKTYLIEEFEHIIDKESIDASE